MSAEPRSVSGQPGSVSYGLERALDLLLPALDIARARVVTGEPPTFCEARGLTAFLSALSDDELARCEAEGLAARLPSLPGAPPALVELARACERVTSLPIRLPSVSSAQPIDPRAIPERKQRQLEALLDAVRPLATRAERIVDVGAGRGHFTRLAAELFERDALGIERDAARVEVAATLATTLAANQERCSRVRFVAQDAFQNPISLTQTDLAVGLHACGALGDRLVLAASAASSDLVLVSCCLQKIDAPTRHPLSSLASRAGLVLPREALGLSNLSARPVGVEASLAEMLDARRRRHALFRLLCARGLQIAPGEEMRGQNRRRAYAPFADLVAQALALRGLAPATPAELREHEREGSIEFGKIRRFSLPRAMLARPLEITVVLDRAAFLEEQGHHVRVVEVFDQAVTPRNLGIFAEAQREGPP